ncbi:MAG: hypothetical protein K0Q72_3090, partial [Armatimonadetes bacterium]|nr:hypothetical protein [Armatimonadota bacterium]
MGGALENAWAGSLGGGGEGVGGSALAF